MGRRYRRRHRVVEHRGENFFRQQIIAKTHGVSFFIRWMRCTDCAPGTTAQIYLGFRLANLLVLTRAPFTIRRTRWAIQVHTNDEPYKFYRDNWRRRLEKSMILCGKAQKLPHVRATCSWIESRQIYLWTASEIGWAPSLCFFGHFRVTFLHF